jgi:hypothetical protein
MSGKKLFWGADRRVSNMVIPKAWDGIITQNGDRITFSFIEEDVKTYLVFGYLSSLLETQKDYRLVTRLSKSLLFKLFSDRQAFLFYCDKLWIETR